jgi:tight adherence protein B
MPWIMAGLMFVMIVSVVGWIALRNDVNPQQLASRIGRPQVVDQNDIARTQRRLPATTRSALSWIYRMHLAQQFEENLWQAGIYARVSDVMMVMVLLFCAGAAIGAAIGGSALIGVAGGFGCASIPIAYVRVRRRRRMNAFLRQLPFALDLMRSSLEAGHSLVRGFHVVVSEFSDPISTEFRSVIEQSRLGLPVARAMEEMLKRVPDEDLRLFVVAMRVQAEVGSSLAMILGRISEIIRTRQRLAQQIHALTAQSRMSGWVIGLLPFFVLAGFGLMNPDYVNLLFYDPTGELVLKGAIALDVVALFTIRKLLKVKF